jgi:hypothetical protein
MHFLYGGFILHLHFVVFLFTRGFDSIVWLCVIACNLCLVDVLCILDLSFVLFFPFLGVICIDIFKSLG